MWLIDPRPRARLLGPRSSRIVVRTAARASSVLLRAERGAALNARSAATLPSSHIRITSRRARKHRSCSIGHAASWRGVASQPPRRIKPQMEQLARCQVCTASEVLELVHFPADEDARLPPASYVYDSPCLLNHRIVENGGRCARRDSTLFLKTVISPSVVRW